MSKQETFQDQEHDRIVPKCEGCGNVLDSRCKAYMFPEAKWRTGNCPMATHIERMAEVAEKAPDPFVRERRRKARRW